MSKICHVTSVHSRYDGRILKKECCSLARAGYEVVLLCIDGAEEEIYQGVRIYNINHKFKNRFSRIAKTSRLLLPKALEIDADVYHLHDPELLQLGAKLKKRGKKVIFDSHEDVPASIREKAWLPYPIRSFASHQYEKRERKILKRLDGVITVTPHILERLIKINPNTVMVTNYPILSDELCERRQSSVCFAGGITAQWMHENVIRAVEKFSGRIQYVLAGDTNSAYFDALQQLKGFENVVVKGIVPQSKVLEIYSKSFAGIALNDYVANVGFHKGSIGNTKLFEYMGAGLPIVCTDFDLWKEIVQEQGAGICVDPHDIEQIASALEYLLSHEKEANEMGRRARKLAEDKYNWKLQEKILLQFYEEICS